VQTEIEHILYFRQNRNGCIRPLFKDKIQNLPDFSLSLRPVGTHYHYLFPSAFSDSALRLITRSLSSSQPSAHLSV
jgi:hypothetical protein